MHLASDYIHPTPRGGKCRIHVPEEEHDAPVIICSELPNNEGSSVTNSAHQITAEVIRYYKMPVLVWIEHYPKEATDGTSETFELVVFSNYEIRERTPHLGEHSRRAHPIPRSGQASPAVGRLSLRTLAPHLSTQPRLTSNHPAATPSLDTAERMPDL